MNSNRQSKKEALQAKMREELPSQKEEQLTFEREAGDAIKHEGRELTAIEVEARGIVDEASFMFLRGLYDRVEELLEEVSKERRAVEARAIVDEASVTLLGGFYGHVEQLLEKAYNERREFPDEKLREEITDKLHKQFFRYEYAQSFEWRLIQEVEKGL